MLGRLQPRRFTHMESGWRWSRVSRAFHPSSRSASSFSYTITFSRRTNDLVFCAPPRPPSLPDLPPGLCSTPFSSYCRPDQASNSAQPPPPSQRPGRQPVMNTCYRFAGTPAEQNRKQLLRSAGAAWSHPVQNARKSRLLG